MDSFIFSYSTVSGSQDVLKIEINYSNRLHVLPIISDQRMFLKKESVSIRRLSDAELIGSKLNALITRTTSRDLYDAFNLFKKGIKNKNLVKKITIFYVVLGSEIPVSFDEVLEKCLINIKNTNYNKLRDTLIPVLRKDRLLDIEELKSYVASELKEMFILDNNELEYIKKFNSGIFDQKLLFNDDVIENLECHPMVIWKTRI